MNKITHKSLLINYFLFFFEWSKLALKDVFKRSESVKFRSEVILSRIDASEFTSDMARWAEPSNGIPKYSRSACSEVFEENEPFCFINSRARGRVSRKRQLSGMFIEQRLNSFARNGTSKRRALWATNMAISPGPSRLFTYLITIGIKSSILNKKSYQLINLSKLRYKISETKKIESSVCNSRMRFS